MDIITLLLAQGYTDTVAKTFAGGLKYQGSKLTVADLPAASESNKGHMYTITANGHEYVSDGTQWIDLSADLDKKADKTYVDQQDALKQDKLTAGKNIIIDAATKTISALDTAIDNKTIKLDNLNQLETAVGGYIERTDDYSILKTVDISIPEYIPYFINDITEIQVYTGSDLLDYVYALKDSASFNSDEYKFKLTYKLDGNDYYQSELRDWPSVWYAGDQKKLEFGLPVCILYGYRNNGGNPDYLAIDSHKSTLPAKNSYIRVDVLHDDINYTYHKIDSKFIDIDNFSIKLNNNTLYADLSTKQDKLTAGTNITIENNVISASGALSPEYINLGNYVDGDTGTLTEAQAEVLLASELNYIWLNGMHRLDFRYRDDSNNKAVYATADSSSDGTKTHSVEINLSTKKFKVYHKQLQEKLTAGTNITIDGNTISATQPDISGKADKTYVDTQDATKINLLGNVDDPSDPGYGYAYHFPYDATFTPAEDKITIGLKTITLDNNKYKMLFNKDLPAATINSIGLMTASDARAVREDLPSAITNKQDKLTAGDNITIDTNNKISATVTTYRPLKSEWKQTSTYGGITMAEFCGHINDDPSVKEGDAYCGNINSKNFFSGMYFEDPANPLESAEVNVQIMGAWQSGHVQLLTVTSSNHAPYFWQYTWVDGLASWVSWTDVRKLDTSTTANYLKYLSLNGTEYKIPDGDTIESNISTLTENMGGRKIKALTQTDYDNLEKKDENTLYFIIKKA